MRRKRNRREDQGAPSSSAPAAIAFLCKLSTLSRVSTATATMTPLPTVADPAVKRFDDSQHRSSRGYRPGDEAL